MSTTLNIRESNSYLDYFFPSNTVKGPDKKTVEDIKKGMPAGTEDHSSDVSQAITYTGTLTIRNPSKDADECTVSLKNFEFQNPGSKHQSDKVVLYQPGLQHPASAFFKVEGTLDTNVTRTGNKYTTNNAITFPEGTITIKVGDEELRSQSFAFVNGSRFNRITVSFSKDEEGKTIATVDARPDRTLRSDCDDCAGRTADCFGSVWKGVASGVSYSGSVVTSLFSRKKASETSSKTSTDLVSKVNIGEQKTEMSDVQPEKNDGESQRLDSALEGSGASYHSSPTDPKDPMAESAFEVLGSTRSTPEKEEPKATSNTPPSSPSSRSIVGAIGDFFGIGNDEKKKIE